MDRNKLIKIFLLLTVLSSCVLCLRDNSGAAVLYKIKYEIGRRQLTGEIEELEGKLSSIYEKIGQKICTQDTGIDSIRNEIDQLVSLSGRYNFKINSKRQQLNAGEKELLDSLKFENLLNNLFSENSSLRLQALELISAEFPKKGAPYIGMLLLDSSDAVKTEAALVLKKIITSSSVNIEKNIPNIKQLGKILQSKNSSGSVKGGYQIEEN